jgi:hypothetical protein
MAALKERGQNPIVGDTVRLHLLIMNQHNFADPQSVGSVEIYTLDPTFVSCDNHDGRRLVATVDGADVQKADVGSYFVDLVTTDPAFTIGRYLDIWTVQFENEPHPAKITQHWKIYPDLWFTSPIPIVYDFQFKFQPNRFRQGEKKYLRIEIVPQVPNASDLAKYYENLAIVSDVKISIEQACGPCIPAETDLRLIVDSEDVTFREKRYAYYQLDTEDFDCGIYNVWFKLELAGNTYISDKNQLEIYS